MCGIVGVATVAGRELSVPRGGVEAMRDRLAHRGPDGAGLWWDRHVALGHRRLAVVGLGEDGAQPMASACGRHVLVYNGELYNDDLVRAALERDGASAARTATDTETVVRALARWGTGAIRMLRGMFALAWFDRTRKVLTLARDPLGIKPLLWARVATPGGGEEVVLGSEAAALLAHPHVSAQPDWGVVSAYLTTIRTTLGSRTMFRGIRTVRPAEVVEIDLSGAAMVVRHATVGVRAPGGASDVDDVREVVAESVARHLRSDVPVCGLLSGGLDSTIVCAEARGRVGLLRTYCAGAKTEGLAVGPGAGSPDFAFARDASAAIGTAHTECVVSREGFAQRWGWMVEQLGVPLSTPNEVAIHEVAACLRGHGHVVALSGEGADELFGGYDRPLSAAQEWLSARAERGRLGASSGALGVFVLDHAAWMPRDAKAAMLRPALWEAVEHDAALVETYRDDMVACVGDALDMAGRLTWPEREAAMQGVLLHQRRTNLVGLLGRLDGAMMLAGVEGRTPLADAEVAAVADGLPMGLKFHGPGGGTKVALREGWRGRVPDSIIERAKASFPLPFQGWLADSVPALMGSDLAASVFEPGAIDLVRADPARCWNLAWPMLNLAMWGKRWGW